MFAKYHWFAKILKFGSSPGPMYGHRTPGQPGSEKFMHIDPSAPFCSTALSVPVCGQLAMLGPFRYTTLFRSIVIPVMNLEGAENALVTLLSVSTTCARQKYVVVLARSHEGGNDVFPLPSGTVPVAVIAAKVSVVEMSNR